jgi:hypothetical protein
MNAPFMLVRHPSEMGPKTTWLHTVALGGLAAAVFILIAFVWMVTTAR